MKRVLLIALFIGACGQQGSVSPITTPAPQTAPDQDVFTVQFCPGVKATYPSAFPEYGLCIQGQLYAVYSANGGFLALLPPGVYLSNAIGSACDFTVASGCVIK